MASKDVPTVDPIVVEAQDRLNRVLELESVARQRYQDDLKFADADPYNLYQWPNDVRQNRGIDERPTLTINKIRQHNLQIINEGRQNKPSIKVIPTSGDASYDAAQIWNGIIRYVEYRSGAQEAYTTAQEFQVKGGIGYIRVLTEYVSDNSFDQTVCIQRVKNPLDIALDPDIQCQDGSDARYGFVFKDIPRDMAEKLWPKYKDVFTQQTLDQNPQWCNENTIRMAEYFYKEELQDTLVSFVQGNQRLVIKESLMAPQAKKLIMADPNTRTRSILTSQIKWKKIIGQTIVEEKDWPGHYIPIVRVLGEETWIDGQLDRKGHTRAMIDPQRMYNYWSSAATEYATLQSKTPYVGPMAAFENFENYWEAANRTNSAWLPYNHKDEDGNEVPPPQRQQPPVMAPAYLQGMQYTGMELESVSGQHPAMKGEDSNERTGIAIRSRQQQGDNSTYHFRDNLAIAVKYCGIVVMDLVRQVFDTQRVIQIMGEDGEMSQVKIDPQAQQALQQVAGNAVFNPRVGEYDLQVTAGPAFGTRREEAFAAFTQMITQNPALGSIIGDLLFKAADFPQADEAAKRLKNMVPPQALGNGPSPQEQQLMQQLEELKGIMQELMQENATLKVQNKDKGEENKIKSFDAATARLKVLLEDGTTKEINLNEMIKLSVETELEQLRLAQEARRTEEMGEAK